MFFNSTKHTEVFACPPFCVSSGDPLFPKSKGSGIEGPGEAVAGLEGDLLRQGLWDEHLIDANPQHHRVGLDASDLPQLAILDERRNLGVVRHLLHDFLEGVLHLLSLHQPNEARVAVVPELLDVLQWKEALGQAELLQQLHGHLPALGVSG